MLVVCVSLSSLLCCGCHGGVYVNLHCKCMCAVVVVLSYMCMHAFVYHKIGGFDIILCIACSKERGLCNPLFLEAFSSPSLDKMLLAWFIPPYPGELRFVATHGDNDGRVHWRPLPPNRADGHWLPMRSSPNVSLILDGTSQTFTNCLVQATQKGLTLVSIFTKNK